MLLTSYRWHLFILYDVIVFSFYFIFYFLFISYFILILFYCKPHEAQMFQCSGPLFCKPPEAQMF